jgi:TonB family protein
MSCERTIALSIFLHVLVLAAFSIQLKSRFVMPSAFEVNLVSTGETHAPPAQEKTAPIDIKTPEKKKPAVKEKTKTAAVVKPVKKPVMAPVKPTPAEPKESVEELREGAIGKIEKNEAIAEIRKRVKIEGTLSIGKAAPGTGTKPGATANSPLAAYLDLVKQEIKKRWRYPDGDTNGLIAVINIIIHHSGMLEPSIEASSGNNRLDQSAIRAVESASPVSPPPYPYYELQIGIKFHDENTD